MEAIGALEEGLVNSVMRCAIINWSIRVGRIFNPSCPVRDGLKIRPTKLDQVIFARTLSGDRVEIMSFIREPNAEPIPGYRLIEPLGSGGLSGANFFRA